MNQLSSTALVTCFRVLRRANSSQSLFAPTSDPMGAWMLEYFSVPDEGNSTGGTCFMFMHIHIHDRTVVLLWLFEKLDQRRDTSAGWGNKRALNVTFLFAKSGGDNAKEAIRKKMGPGLIDSFFRFGWERVARLFAFRGSTSFVDCVALRWKLKWAGIMFRCGSCREL